MRLFWQKGRKIRSTERFKTSAILNARFRENYFKLFLRKHIDFHGSDILLDLKVMLCTRLL